MLVRACIDEARRLRRHRVDVELTILDAPVVTGLESAIADRDQLERGFLRAEPDARALIVLHHHLDLPLPEVATTLGIPLGTAKSRLHRALQAMRAALDADARYRPEVRRVVRMTTNDAFGRNLSAWLHEDAAHQVPDHLEEVLQRTVTTRQRRAWSSLERWLPMDTIHSAGWRRLPGTPGSWSSSLSSSLSAR